MVLHKSNFEIPARFSFQPYSAKWRYANAETVEWVEESKLRPIMAESTDKPEKTALRVRIGAPNLYGFGLELEPSRTVLMDRASIPPDLLPAHANHRNTPDIAGLQFKVLVCQKPEFKDGLWRLNPGNATKNARAMLDEFVNLKAHPLPELGWNFSVRQFLNKWGLWSHDSGFSEDWASVPIRMMPLLQKHDRPDFVLVTPHLLKEQQEKYRNALQPSHRHSWLRSHHLSLDPTDDFPPFVVRASYCSQAIEATITIVHLAGLKFGICKRCGSAFEKETRHKKSYCSERCFNAAGVQRWREKQRKVAKKGAKQNAKG
jgi:endogenous inhibitor of DNA gyrase (YacG/DUF329 family)